MAEEAAASTLDAIVAGLTLDEKVDLLSGKGMWHTQPIARYDIPSIVMTDGAYGVRYSVEQIEDKSAGGVDLASFLEVVNRRARDMDAAFGTSKPATCFPTGSCIANSWDSELLEQLGIALGTECRALGVNILLGPAINIRRTPLGGRGYEYYSEDPLLTGELAAAVIEGIQQMGVGTSLKHFACNNSEIERTTMDSIVDERTLREIYLFGFERAITKAKPWSVMSSYNLLNHVQTSQSPWLLTQVLRREWGYRGAVISDWHGIKDRPASLRAGNDLDMPESAARKRQLAAAIGDGSVLAATVDESCRRVLELVQRCSAAREPVSADLDRHHRLARRMAAESTVLLKNDDALLPIDFERVKRIAVIGEAAKRPVIQGSGSATVGVARVDIPYDELLAAVGDRAQLSYAAGYGETTAGEPTPIDAALQAASGADLAIVFVHTDQAEDGEGADRRDLALSAGQDSLIDAVAACCPRVLVVAACPDAICMPWIDNVDAVLATFLAGQGMGEAVAKLICGEANPCGKLAVTFPRRIEDTPSFLTYPGEAGQHRYAEGIYVGYRYYDKRQVEPLFPFGFGLSYTTFAYDRLQIDAPAINESDALRLSFDVANTGKRPGKEICQVYVHWPDAAVHRPVNELKAFVKVALAPGETKTVTVSIPARDFQYFDVERGQWRLAAGNVAIRVGSSSRDIRLERSLRSEPGAAPARRITLESQPKFILENPSARAAFIAFLQTRLHIDAQAATDMLEYTVTSFFGIFTTLNYFFRLDLTEHEVQAVIDGINAPTRHIAVPTHYA